jgi:hypothetical protein
MKRQGKKEKTIEVERLDENGRKRQRRKWTTKKKWQKVSEEKEETTELQCELVK